MAVPDKCVKFYDPRLNRSLEIRPEAVGGSIFDRFFSNSHKCQPDLAGDISSRAID